MSLSFFLLALAACATTGFKLQTHAFKKSHYLLSSAILASFENEREQCLVLPTNLKNDFPILSDNNLLYLDSAATSQQPLAVINAGDHYVKNIHSNINRGAHRLGALATEAYEASRSTIKNFFNAKHIDEIVFSSGATSAANMVAQGWTPHLGPGDEIIVSIMEHHSNLLPWQSAAKASGAQLRYVMLNETDEFDLNHFYSLLNDRTKVVALSHCSNVLGSLTPVKAVAEAAHRHGAIVVLDACQSAPHVSLDVQELDVDFMVVAGHKLCGPTGVGVLYGKRTALQALSPMCVGGGIADEVTQTSAALVSAPHRFEAGTPPIAQAIGLAAAVDYLCNIGMDRIQRHCQELGRHLHSRLSSVPGVRVYGPARRESGLTSFSVSGCHPFDLVTALDLDGVAVRGGFHCAQPLHAVLPGAELGTVRVSPYIYNSIEDIDRFMNYLQSAINMFK